MTWTRRQFVPVAREELLDAYSDWVRSHVEDGWEAFLLTFMFRPLPGSPNTQISVMQDEIMRVYATLATRIVRKPNSRRGSRFLPKGIFFPDRPVYKHRKSTLRDASINDGLHIHGIMVARRGVGLKLSRLRERLDHHLIRNMDKYTNDKLVRIHIELITYRPDMSLDTR